MYLFVKNYIETQGEGVDSNSAISPPVAYDTGRSKGVILVLFLFCVALLF